MKTTLILLGLWLSTIGLAISQFRIAANLREALAVSERQAAYIQQEHEATIKALLATHAAKEKIHAQGQTLSQSLDKALELSPGFADIPVPDGLCFSYENSHHGISIAK